MWNRETITGVASIPIGVGGGWVLNWFGHSVIALTLAIILVIGGLVFLMYGLKKVKDEKNTVEKQRELLIRAKVVDNPLLNFAESISVPPHSNEKLKTIEVAFQIEKPIVLNKLALELWGQQFPTEEFADILKLKENTIIEHSDCFKVAFFIPDKYAVNNPKANIYVMVNNLEHRSEPFAVNFGG